MSEISAHDWFLPSSSHEKNHTMKSISSWNNSAKSITILGSQLISTPSAGGGITNFWWSHNFTVSCHAWYMNKWITLARVTAEQQVLQLLSECSSGLWLISNVLYSPALGGIITSQQPLTCVVQPRVSRALSHTLSHSSLEHHPGEFLCLCSHLGRLFQQSLKEYFPIIFSPKFAFINYITIVLATQSFFFSFSQFFLSHCQALTKYLYTW